MRTCMRWTALCTRRSKVTSRRRTSRGDRRLPPPHYLNICLCIPSFHIPPTCPFNDNARSKSMVYEKARHLPPAAPRPLSSPRRISKILAALPNRIHHACPTCRWQRTSRQRQRWRRIARYPPRFSTSRPHPPLPPPQGTAALAHLRAAKDEGAAYLDGVAYARLAPRPVDGSESGSSTQARSGGRSGSGGSRRRSSERSRSVRVCRVTGARGTPYSPFGDPTTQMKKSKSSTSRSRRSNKSHIGATSSTLASPPPPTTTTFAVPSPLRRPHPSFPASPWAEEGCATLLSPSTSRDNDSTARRADSSHPPPSDSASHFPFYSSGFILASHSGFDHGFGRDDFGFEADQEGGPPEPGIIAFAFAVAVVAWEYRRGLRAGIALSLALRHALQYEEPGTAISLSPSRCGSACSGKDPPPSPFDTLAPSSSPSTRLQPSRSSTGKGGRGEMGEKGEGGGPVASGNWNRAAYS
ncbi:hypothetical protein MSAN_01684200 [Mycena sanguinolenta]|uniref:Uncharacterized protein n=1 Tax=Mycena sanguinolenta TaxID=230812 RepID=A0A8H6XZF8_9AGAR|nr:hypothetical protein MSAN_01684200 [Mycena sanguinolenta]